MVLGQDLHGFWLIFLNDFGRQLGVQKFAVLVQKGAPGLSITLFSLGSLLFWFDMGAKMTPGPFQDTPITLSRLIFYRFWSKLGGFWTPTWWILDPYWAVANHMPTMLYGLVGTCEAQKIRLYAYMHICRNICKHKYIKKCMKF